MPYKIALEVETTVKKFQNLLTEREIPRGAVITCRIYATNIGNTIIPKSVTSSCVIHSNRYQNSFTNFEIPSLEPNKRTFIKQIQFTPYENGVIWLVIIIKPVNNENFSYYHIGSDEGQTNDWRNLYYVADKEMLEILSLLKTPTTLTKRKKKKKKKSLR